MRQLNARRNRIFALGISTLIPFFAFAQNYNLPLNQSFNFELNRDILKEETIIHSSFKPILQTEVKSVSPRFLEAKTNDDKSFVSRKLFHEHFIRLDTGNVKLSIDPLFNLEAGNELETDDRNIDLYKNVRGFNLKMQLGEKVFVESSFRENQANLPLFVAERTEATGVAYGQGRTKKFKENGVDFAMASAYISYSPSNRVNIQAGHGKHFVGNGHRSLLLSDLAFNYPYLKINTNWLDNKLQYQNLFTLFQDLERLNSNNISEGLFERKQGAFHYLEFSPNNKWSIAIFEGVIFPSIDTSGNISVGANYWAPVLFLNTLIEGGENKGNSLIGTNFTLNLGGKIQLYNQLAIPDEQFDDLAFQLGAKYYIHKNLMLQGEFNSTAGLGNNAMYSHYNESLNYPIAADVSELVGIAQFKKDRWMTRATANYIIAELDDVQFAEIRQSYVVNPSFNFTVHLGAQLRNVSQNDDVRTQVVRNLPYSSTNSAFIYVGFSTNLQNLYFNY